MSSLGVHCRPENAARALEVIDAFWHEHGEYAEKRPAVFHRSMARHLTTWIYQWPPGDIALSSELVQENVGLYEEAMEGTDRMTAVIRRAPPSQRNGLSSDAPQFFFQQDLHFDMLAMHEARVATETHEPAQPYDGPDECRARAPARRRRRRARARRVFR